MKKDFLNKQTDIANEIICEIFSEYLNDVDEKTSEVEIPDVENATEKVEEKTPEVEVEVPEVEVEVPEVEVEVPDVEDAAPRVEESHAPNAMVPSENKSKENDLKRELRDMELREADKLERFFSGVNLPNEPVDVVPGYCIVEPPRYVKAALRAIRSGKYDTDEFLERLRQLRDFINAAPREEVTARWKKDNWDERIKFVEERLIDCKAGAPIKLDDATQIDDIDKFVASHLAIVKAHSGNKQFEPYLQRLEKLAGLL